MADVQARVLKGEDGGVALYLWSDEKTAGGASKRYASISVEDGEVFLTIGSRAPDKADISPVTMNKLGKAFVRAFAHVQWHGTTETE